MSTFPTGTKRGLGAPSSRGRVSRSSRASSRQSNPIRDSNAHEEPSMKAGRGRGSGTTSSMRGQRASSAVRMENGRSSGGLSRGLRGTKSQSSSPFGSAPTNSIFSIDRARDPRRQQGSVPPFKPQKKDKNQDYMSRFEQLKRERTKQRTKAINEGLMADPSQPTSLNRAITPTGACTDMCPEYERVERIVQKMVDKSEKLLNLDTGELDIAETRMIKRFRRSAAGYDEQLPSDIRTPNALLQTLNYILRYVISDDDTLGGIHKFVWDRTRSIRNDLSIQQLTQQQDVEIAVKCLERIARFHILSLHLLSSPTNTEQFDHHQEREQLNNTLLSLLYYYDDFRGRMVFPNEDEFRAYYILFSIHDQRPDLEARVQKWPRELLHSPRIKVALELFAAAGNTWEYQGTLDARRPNAIAQGLYSRFFNLVRSKSVSYLMACIAEIYFSQVRQTAIRSIWKAYCRQPLSQQHKNQEWTIDRLTTALWLDDEDQTIKFCEDQDLELATDSEGRLYLDWGSRSVDSVAFQPSSQQIFSERLVESKRYGRTQQAIILGMSVSQALKHGMIDKMLLHTESESAAVSAKGDGEHGGLFVSDDEGEKELQKNHDNISNIEVQAEMPSTSPSIFSRSLESGNSQTSTNPFINHLTGTFPAGSPSTSSLSASAPPFVPQGLTNFTKSQPAQSVPSSIESRLDEVKPPVSSSPFPSVSMSGPSAPVFSPFGSNFGNPFASKLTSAKDATAPQLSPFPAKKGLFGTPSAPETVSFGRPSSSPAVATVESVESPKTPPFAPFTSNSSTIATDQPDIQKTTSKGQGSKIASTTLFQGTWGGASPAADTVSKPSNSAHPEQPQNPLFPSTSAGIFGLQPSESRESAPSPFGVVEPLQKQTSSQANAGKAPTSLFSSPQPTESSKPTKSVLSTSIISSTPSSNPFSATPPFTGSQNQKSLDVKGPEPKYPPPSLVGQPSSPKKTQGAPAPAVQPPTSRPSEKPVEDQDRVRRELEQRAVREHEKRRILEVEAAKKEAAKRELERLKAARIEKEKKEAVEREAARREKMMREQEEELRAARREIEKREAIERKAAEKEAARKNAIEKEVAKRKALDGENEEEQSRGKAKMAKLSPKQTLTVEELLALELSKQKAAPPKQATERKSLIDEDELLFTAARMAGRELSRTGLFDGIPQLPESVSRPSTPASSFSSSIMGRASVSSREISDGQHAMVNGYKVALAPETPLGLGRSLSRTEQRIRLTGAHGLAYKPIANLLRTPNEKGKQRAPWGNTIS
ncbi:SAC3/GANP family protein [Coccidioides posadasii C735 delta SOWgp]|uniref:SAC3/GANP/THP3 conserved domain-containing protein n=2 Tax=Coccidioides posadasii TaxID=199306 RepID=A0A0J6FE72_COCPO|nr:SAC3/GANP family protein [Coccidioides posadasii C735 delta SOWgp]EER27387.1 SAC3/GANP family protein [Coccidioides posadasii C735 delta SOWgp]KMM67194.1 hypothetical protein CPAG_03529 [Coccidioides posadasii RMSCC 3488]|eukprot:XP_003069532.1 SAC3/GANP family protein [Coccidioides posadasii C735 delta SOWgp]